MLSTVENVKEYLFIILKFERNIYLKQIQKNVKNVKRYIIQKRLVMNVKATIINVLIVTFAFEENKLEEQIKCIFDIDFPLQKLLIFSVMFVNFILENQIKYMTNYQLFEICKTFPK